VSGLPASAARRCYGFQNMTVQTARVEASIEESLHIRESIRRLSEDQEAAATQIFIDELNVDFSVESDCLPGTTTDNKCFVFDELISALFEGNLIG